MNFKKINLVAGWAVFALALVVYSNTIEPTVSFWDCGEFIACSARLEIGHQPGAPFFLILGRIFAIMAGENKENIALMINGLSALSSAFAIMILFRIIILMAGRMYTLKAQDTVTTLLITLGAFFGSMICAFSDTFWFSAVEGEVYALSSLFTAIVFWAMLKWSEKQEDELSQVKADRWIILIAYLMGLSIGVHLLNLLTIPALMTVYYFTKRKPSIKGFIFTLIISLFCLGCVVFIVIPWLIKVAAYFDLLFVNGFGLPVNSGSLFYIAVLFATIIFLIRYSHSRGKHLLNKVVIGTAVFLAGYSTYILLPVRAAANPPINLNKVDNPFSLLEYIGREQYISRPLIYGPYYNANVTGYKERFTWIPVDGKYQKIQVNGEYEFDKEYMTVFPRMSGTDAQDVEGYKKWAGIRSKKPEFSDNLRFFFRYQVGYMYFRYFMWNFAGRQTENQGTGDIMNGNWISGIPFLDSLRLGKQESYPQWLRLNKGRNEYYLLPLLLGIAGLLFHYMKNRKDFIVVLLFFIFTGLAIVVYLNEIPLTPRERDYAVGGSFYVFCMWIGIGTIAAANWVRKLIPYQIAASVSALLALSIAVLLLSENYDDHDRSERYFARDVAWNYLNSCEKNAILFTNADNDTYPLWYAQEVEGIRTDVRVVLAPFLSADWYIEKLNDWHNDAPPVDLIIPFKKYASGDINFIPYYKRTENPAPLPQLLEFIGSNDPRAMIRTNRDTPVNYYPVNKALLHADPHKAPVTFEVNDRALTKHLIACLDIIAANFRVRPVYFLSLQLPMELGITEYLEMDGFAYRLIPEKYLYSGSLNAGKIDTESLSNKLLNLFRWGSMNNSNVFVDYNCIRTTSVMGIRNTFARLAEELIGEGKKQKALEVLNYCMNQIPHSSVPYDFFVLRIISAYNNAGAYDIASKIMREYREILQQQTEYFNSLEIGHLRGLQHEVAETQYILEQLIELENNPG